MLLQENIPLAPLTTFRIGGPARFFVEAQSRTEVEEAVALARARDLPLFILGGGSNLVVADAGWPGLVLKVAIPGIEQRPGTNDEGKVLFDVGAGESWDRFVSHAVMAQCAGVECLSGIPGSVGGHAGAERGRLRAGSLRDDRVGRSLRSQRQPGARTVPRSLRVRLPLQHLQYDRTRAIHHTEVTYALLPGGELAPRIRRPEAALRRP